MITSNGIIAINSYLTDQIADWAGSIGYGCASAPATTALTTSLGYELGKATVFSKYYSPTASQLVVKASIDNSFSGSIFELGVFPTNLVSANKDAFLFSNFDETGSSATNASSSWLQGSSHLDSNTSASLSNKSLASASSVSVNTSSILSIFNFPKDLSDYTSSDYLHLLYYVPTALATVSNSPSVTFTFYDNASQIWSSNSASLDISSAGYKTASISMATATQYWNGVTQSITASFANSATSSNKSIVFDALRFRDGSTNKPIENTLVSRTTSSNPIFTTTYGQPIQIEYYLTVS